MRQRSTRPSDRTRPVPPPARHDEVIQDEPAMPARGHSLWWMVACCAPMALLAVAILLSVLGSR